MSEENVVSRIKELIDSSDFDGALLILTTAIERTPSADPQLHLLLATVLRHVGPLEDALHNAEVALALLSEDGGSLAANGTGVMRNEAAVLRAAILFETGNLKEAKNSLYELLAEDMTNSGAAGLLEEILRTKFQAVVAADGELLRNLDKNSWEKLWNQARTIRGPLKMSNSELKTVRLMVIFAKLENCGEIPDVPFYQMIAGISSILFDDELARDSYYLANFYVQTKEKSSTSISWQIQLLGLLAVADKNGADISRSVKIMETARKIAIAAGSGPQDMNKINWTLSLLNTRSGNFDRALELSAGMENSHGELLFDSNWDKVYKKNLQAAVNLGRMNFAGAVASLETVPENKAEAMESREPFSDTSIPWIESLKFAADYFSTILPTESTAMMEQVQENKDIQNALKNRLLQKLDSPNDIQRITNFITLAMKTMVEVNDELLSYFQDNSEKTQYVLKNLDALFSGYKSIGIFDKNWETLYECLKVILNSKLNNIDSETLSDHLKNMLENIKGNNLLTIPICMLYIHCVFLQKRFNECLSISYIGERACSLNLNQIKFTDKMIPIQEFRHVFNYIQQYIYFSFFQHHRALFVAERFRSASLNGKSIVSIDLPNDIMSSKLILSLLNYSRLKSTVILYFTDSGNKFMPSFCWILLPEIKEPLYFIFNLNKNESCISENFYKTSTSETRLERSFPDIFRKFNIESTFNNCDILNTISNLWHKINYYLTLSKAKRFIIIPQLRFYNAPFCLMGMYFCNNRNSLSINNFPLLSRYTISLSPSFSAISETVGECNSTISESTDIESLALIIADPQENLDATNFEAEIIINKLVTVKNLNTQPLFHTAASKDIVINSLEKCSIVHFAAHGHLGRNGDEILAGTIILSDGRLNAKDIEVGFVVW